MNAARCLRSAKLGAPRKVDSPELVIVSDHQNIEAVIIIDADDQKMEPDVVIIDEVDGVATNAINSPSVMDVSPSVAFNVSSLDESVSPAISGFSTGEKAEFEKYARLKIRCMIAEGHLPPGKHPGLAEALAAKWQRKWMVCRTQRHKSLFRLHVLLQREAVLRKRLLEGSDTALDTRHRTLVRAIMKEQEILKHWGKTIMKDAFVQENRVVAAFVSERMKHFPLSLIGQTEYLKSGVNHPTIDNSLSLAFAQFDGFDSWEKKLEQVDGKNPILKETLVLKCKNTVKIVGPLKKNIRGKSEDHGTLMKSMNEPALDVDKTYKKIGGPPQSARCVLPSSMELPRDIRDPAPDKSSPNKDHDRNQNKLCTSPKQRKTKSIISHVLDHLKVPINQNQFPHNQLVTIPIHPIKAPTGKEKRPDPIKSTQESEIHKISDQVTLPTQRDLTETDLKKLCLTKKCSVRIQRYDGALGKFL